jgi:hypothetical protein
MRISRSLHEHTHKLEVAVEGTYASDGSDPRIRLLSDSLHMSRLADLELGRLSQSLQYVLQLLQAQSSNSPRLHLLPPLRPHRQHIFPLSVNGKHSIQVSAH